MTQKPNFFRLAFPWHTLIVRDLGRFVLLGTIACTLTFVPPAWGQIPPLPGLTNILTPEPTVGLEMRSVWLDGRQIFQIAGVPVSQADADAQTRSPIELRQRDIEQNLYKILRSDIDPQTLEVTYKILNKQPVVYAKFQIVSSEESEKPQEETIVTVTSLDAKLAPLPLDANPKSDIEALTWQAEARAKQLSDILQTVLKRAVQERQPDYLLKQGAIAIGIFGGAIVLSGITNFKQRRLKAKRDSIALEETPTSSAVATSQRAKSSPKSKVWEGLPIFSLQYEFDKRQRRNWLDLQWRILKIGQLFIWGGATSFALGLFPQTRWLQPLIFAKPSIAIATAVITYIALRVSRLSIDRFFAALEKGEFLDYRTSRRRELRFNTLAPVLKSIAALTCVVVGILVGLLLLGVNISPLIAGAGLVGLAFSFAAQSVLKDAINGFLILMEDQFAVGDVIVVNGKDGFVEYMNLRITQLRNPEGRLITIPNSEITVVENLSKEWSRVDLTVTVAGDADPDRAMETIHQVGEALYRDPNWSDRILELPEVLGIDRLDSEGMLIRTWIKTQPLQQWNVAREFRRRLKLALEEAGIEIGLPHHTIALNGKRQMVDGKRHNNFIAN